jgi:drug/metabolite transporter (DMT)-like permease
VATAVLLPTYLVYRPARSAPPASRADRIRLAVVMVLAVPMNQLFYISGLGFAPAVHGALLFCLTPLLLAIYESLSGHRTAPRITWIGAMIAFSGVVLVLGERGLGLSVDALRGDLLLLVSVVSWCFVTVVSRPLLSTMPSFALTRTTLVGGTAILLPIAAVPMASYDYSAISGKAAACIAFLGVFTSVVAYILWYVLLRRIGPLRSAIILNLQPVGTGLLGWAMLGEPVTRQLLAGGLLVLAGVLVVQLGEARSAAVLAPGAAASPQP